MILKTEKNGIQPQIAAKITHISTEVWVDEVGFSLAENRKNVNIAISLRMDMAAALVDLQG